MKTFKKIMALMIAVVMCMAMAISVYADDPVTEVTKEYEVKINTNEHKTFNAIQIFSGTQEVTGNDNEPLGNIAWGTDVAGKESAIIGAVNTALNLTGDAAIPTNAEAKIVAEKIATATQAQAVALSKALDAALDSVTGTAVQTGNNKLPVGYYLIVDKSTLGNNDAKNMSLLQLTKDIEITLKTDAPTIQKKVKNAGEEDTVYRDANNVAVGDTVNYEITAKIPDMTYYDQYYFIMNDTLSGGLTYLPNSLTVKIETADGTTTTKTLTKDTDYTVTVTPDPLAEGTETKIEIVFKNFIQYKAYGSTPTNLAGQNVVVNYDAKLNQKAVLGTSGNPNQVDLTYSNNPNKKGEGIDKPTEEEEDDVTGTTPKDTVITYSTNLKIKKIDATTQAPLAGVKFNLKGYKENDVITYTEEYTADTNGEYYKLTDNTYTTKAPNALIASSYDSTTTKYKLTVKKNTTTTVTPIEVTDAVTGADGTIDVGTVLRGATGETGSVAAGKYVFTEAETLSGYNLLDEAITVIVKHYPEANDNGKDITISDVTDQCTWTVSEIYDGQTTALTWDADEKAYVITVQNSKGATLPETGGIGTTVFYVIGAILVIGAGIVLVTRRRMSAN